MKRYAIGLVLVLGGVLAACGDDGGDTSDQAVGADQGAAEESADFNDADVAFAQGMIPHHEQAVVMSELAEESAESTDVLELADQIKAAQGPEIEQMTGFLEEWGEEVPSGDMDHGAMGDDEQAGGDDKPMGGMDHSDMPGMMSDQEMTELEASTGAEFDRMFLDMMVRHHEGAVEMSEIELEEGENEEALQLAEDIIDTQENEIAEMEDLLADLS
ncbi:DUF305 domain-containing protein [soil metagenome]